MSTSTPRRRKLSRRALVALSTVTVVTACASACTASPVTGGATVDSTQASTTLRLAEATEWSTLNPLDDMFGFTSKFYDALYAVTADGAMEPSLAAGPATPNSDRSVWEVRVRTDVRFHSGAALSARDVAATYAAVVDPSVGAAVASNFDMLTAVEAVDETTVRFTLDGPYATFDRLLTVGVVPADKAAQPSASSSLNTEPDGSGPYVLDDWARGQSLTMTAAPGYWDGAPQVQQISVSFVGDQTAIAQRLLAGDFDGAQLPPVLAQTFADRDGFEVWANPSADFRAATFPRGVAGMDDPAVRRALNMAVDRQALVDGVLLGYGRAASTPFSPAQGDLFDPDAAFTYDPAAAEALLDEADWRPGPDGVRVKDGQRLTFPLMYFPDDTLRRDLAQAVASDLAKVGVDVDVVAADRPEFRERLAQDAGIFGGGDVPYDPNAHVYTLLHSRFADYDAARPWSNPSGYDNAAVTSLLDRARSAPDPASLDTLYRQVQAEYVADPAMVTLVTLDHTYVTRDLSAWKGVEHVVEPHVHGATWGPWWNVQDWSTRS